MKNEYSQNKSVWLVRGGVHARLVRKDERNVCLRHNVLVRGQSEVTHHLGWA